MPEAMGIDTFRVTGARLFSLPCWPAFPDGASCTSSAPAQPSPFGLNMGYPSTRSRRCGPRGHRGAAASPSAQILKDQLGAPLPKLERAAATRSSSSVSARAHAAVRARRPSRPCGAARGSSASTNAQRPSRAYCSISTSSDAEDDDLVVAAGADQLRQQHLQLVLQELDRRRRRASAPQTWPTPPSTAMNRYSMPMLRPNGDGLTVRWKCANSQPETRRQQRREHEHRDLVARSVSTPIASAIVAPPLSARSARPARESSRCVHGRPRPAATMAQIRQKKLRPGARASMPKNVQRRNAEQAVVLAEAVEVAEQVVQRQAPGDRRQRQVVARHAQRDQAEDQRARPR